jgi:hypothetical protein
LGEEKGEERCTTAPLHHLVLCHTAMGIGIHAVASTRSHILDVAETQRPATVLIALELRDGRFGGLGAVKTDNAASLGSAARLVLDLGLLNLADGAEELDQVIVAC